MSTTFGIIMGEDNQEETIEIAHRRGRGFGQGVEIRWLCKMAKFLPNDTGVIALDNTPQGIETIGDIKRIIDNDGFVINEEK